MALIARNTKAHTQGICDLVFLHSLKLITASFDGSIALLDLANITVVLQRFAGFGEGSTIWRVILPYSIEKKEDTTSMEKKEKEIFMEKKGEEKKEKKTTKR